jgi:predicted dehydrogenase
MVMAADPDPARRHHVADTYPSVAVVTDSNEVIQNPDIDAIVIATPVGMHFKQARQALEVGKHVLVEKPFTNNLAEAIEIARIATKRERVLMVGHTFEYAEAVNHIRTTVRDGELGDLKHIRSLRLNLGLVRNDVNVLWDLAPHDLSILLYVLERFPRKVQATAKATINRSVEDVANITLDFGDELMANIILSWLDPQKVREMTFVGDRKMLIYNDLSPNEKIRIFDKGIEAPRHYDSFGEFQYSYRYGDIRTPLLNEREPLLTECQHFIECCQLGKNPRSGASAGAAVTAIIEATQQSIDLGGVAVDLDMFADNAPFADWLDAAYRLSPHAEETITNRIVPVGHDTRSGVALASRQKAGRLKAMVIDPDESGRVFVAEALMSFEPGFDVVTVAGVDEAAEWIDTFVPDLLIVSEALDQLEAGDFITGVLAAPASRHCKVVSVRQVRNEEAGVARWHHAALNSEAGLSEWLETIHQVLAR